MPRAGVMMRPSPSYRRDAFMAGLTRHGFSVMDGYDRRPGPDDLLLLWNRTRSTDPIARIYEQAGARVIVAENGYIGERPGDKPFALALGFHNGAGQWAVGEKPRWIPEQKPWRERGDHIVVMPQRGIGVRPYSMPLDWPRRIEARLAKLTDRPIRMRRHPGAERPDPWPDLVGAHAVVTWGSGGGIKAIAHGVPVFHDMPEWIGRVAALPLVQDLEMCFTGDRERLWRIISWAQWRADEIESGEAFEGLLHARGSDLFCQSKSPLAADRGLHGRGGRKPRD